MLKFTHMHNAFNNGARPWNGPQDDTFERPWFVDPYEVASVCGGNLGTGAHLYSASGEPIAFVKESPEAVAKAVAEAKTPRLRAALESEE